MSRVSIRTLLLGLALGLVLAPRPVLATPPTLKDFFRNPERAGFAISPDGKYLSWVAPYENRLNVFVRPLAGGTETRVTAETARDISGYFWKGDRILYVKDFGGDENFHVVSVDLAGKDLKDLTPGEKLRAEIEKTLTPGTAESVTWRLPFQLAITVSPVEATVARALLRPFI